MFRHTGRGRTFSHNLRLASLLSAVAGIVNIVGLLSFRTLTTNVTGHFAFFAEELFLKNYVIALVFLFYILFFLLGAFVSSLLMERVSVRHPQYAYVWPIILEIAVLLSVSVFGTISGGGGNDIIPTILSCALLFAMGLQNALVTRVSGSVVRTTHLTGLFTDLGIDISKFFFRLDKQRRKQLRKGILLKFTIIGCFFLGGLIGGFGFQQIGIYMLMVASAILLFTLWYDGLLFRYYHIVRRFRHHQHERG
ncbi:DUF1275 domain-containing protein [Parapedobacter sp. SGR-10]|uniref:YoaK family protein n=1 Tax=Parapedobacter sp. SGR-10 TaxID=2710879 RepID=UPI0013D55762|nr:YoaK family protein [Parapedobacter sp. SGR-10]NGF57845.1 DUF1275 domain-containing protein [Parapedobacter sp. SGR-10]